MTCNDRKLIIYCCTTVASLVITLIGILLVLDKQVPTEPWMIISSVVAVLGTAFQGRNASPQTNNGTINQNTENTE